mmetsp:Transcript_11899/g.29442  ORF Transcript_11899/g.29442 Transcript_11899/m.29442 type:complete len:303 (+) Transcript_11899:2088-2996(+)
MSVNETFASYAVPFSVAPGAAGADDLPRIEPTTCVPWSRVPVASLSAYGRYATTFRWLADGFCCAAVCPCACSKKQWPVSRPESPTPITSPSPCSPMSQIGVVPTRVPPPPRGVEPDCVIIAASALSGEYSACGSTHSTACSSASACAKSSASLAGSRSTTSVRHDSSRTATPPPPPPAPPPHEARPAHAAAQRAAWAAATRETARCAASSASSAAGSTSRALSETCETFAGSNASKCGVTLSSGRSGTTRTTSGRERRVCASSGVAWTSRSSPSTERVRAPSRSRAAGEAAWPSRRRATKT